MASPVPDSVMARLPPDVRKKISDLEEELRDGERRAGQPSCRAGPWRPCKVLPVWLRCSSEDFVCGGTQVTARLRPQRDSRFSASGRVASYVRVAIEVRRLRASLALLREEGEARAALARTPPLSAYHHLPLPTRCGHTVVARMSVGSAR